MRDDRGDGGEAGGEIGIAVAQQAERDMGAIQGRDGEQVEEHEHDVDGDADETEGDEGVAQ